MKKLNMLGACIGLAAVMLCSGCGRDQKGEDISTGAMTESIAETTTAAEVPDTPKNLAIQAADTGMMLSWESVEAEGYKVYRGSSRFSDDFVAISDVITDTTFVDVQQDYGYYKVAAVNGGAESELTDAVSLETAMFGKNVYIYSPADDPKEVNKELTLMFSRQETAQFGKNRYAVLFKPGEYAEEIQVKMGFYMEVMGLGITPTETTIQSFQCPATWLGDDSNHNATCNFWRATANLQVNSNVMWAVSQATSMRRMQINGNLALHDNYGWSSGGFLSDSVINGIVDSGSQQQWLSRNCDWKMWSGENWNIVFVGTEEGKAPKGTWPAYAYTSVADTPVVREKPYLVYQDGTYRVFVPDLQENTQGVSWVDGADGSLLSLDDFYIARAGEDTAETMNAALAEGRHLLITPGIYELDAALEVNNPDTIVLGMGYATLIPTSGNLCMQVADVDGVKIGGLLFDAGTTESETLLMVGEEGAEADHAANPILLSDVFFRVGGVEMQPTAVQSCVVLNSNHIIGDNFWVWRADHGSGVAWNKNTAPNGIIVNGDNITIYALMVEHFLEYQTVWNGENGSVYFYQSEMPYDVPNQEEWQSHDGAMNGYASYYVADHVTTHTAYGIGIYSYHRDAVVEAYCAMEVPEVPGMDLHNVCAVMITGNPGITHVINDYGTAAYTGGTRSIIKDFQAEREKAAAETAVQE